MSDLRSQLAEVELRLSVNRDLLLAYSSPSVTDLIKNRIDELEKERSTLLALIEGGAA